MTISISDLSPVTSDSLLTSVDREEGGVIKSAVTRALEARKVVGGLTKLKPIVEEPVYPCPPLIVGLIAIDPPTLETI